MTAPRTPFPPLERVDLPTVGTRAAAHYLRRSIGTMHAWSSTGEGPIKPRRIGGRLEWSTRELRSLLGVEAA
jgi:hypothetical protein